MMRKHCLVLYGVFSHYLVQELCAQNCFVSQFPQLYGGTEGDTVINGMDMNPNSKDVSDYSVTPLIQCTLSHSSITLLIYR